MRWSNKGVGFEKVIGVSPHVRKKKKDKSKETQNNTENERILEAEIGVKRDLVGSASQAKRIARA